MQTVVEELIRRARSGEKEAFGELMTRHRALVRRTAYAILRNADDAEDVLQDVSLKVFCKLDTFESQAAFSTWLTRIVINTSLMYLRKARRAKLSSLDEMLDPDGGHSFEASDPSPGPEQRFISRDARIRLREEIMQLPSNFRTVMEDRVYHELSMVTVAERSGVSVAAAKSRVLRARTMLSQRLSRSRSTSTQSTAV